LSKQFIIKKIIFKKRTSSNWNLILLTTEQLSSYAVKLVKKKKNVKHYSYARHDMIISRVAENMRKLKILIHNNAIRLIMIVI